MKESRDFSSSILTINGQSFLGEICTWYDGPLDYYIPSEDIYLRCIDENRTMWAKFKGKGDLTMMSWVDLFNTHKMWEPVENRVGSDGLMTFSDFWRV